MRSQSEAPDFSIKEMFVFNNGTRTMLNRNSFAQWLRDRSGSRQRREKRIARTEVD
jgi:hypothetical protein